MRNYYYLVSSLKFLLFGEIPPMLMDDFLAECEKWLTRNDLKVLFCLKLGDNAPKPLDTGFLRCWKSFDGDLRRMLADLRAKTPAEPGRLQEKLKDALATDNPLAMEKNLEKIRWEFLDEAALSSYFDINAILIYSLKLQILHRLAQFNKDIGEENFNKYVGVDYQEAIG